MLAGSAWAATSRAPATLSRAAVQRGSTALTWLYSDHQGTQQIAVNAGTQAVTIRRQTPYGGVRGAATAWVNEKGFAHRRVVHGVMFTERARPRLSCPLGS